MSLFFIFFILFIYYKVYGVRTVSRTYSLHHGQSGRKVTVAFAALLYMLQVNYTVDVGYYGIFSRDNRFFSHFY